ncbi:testis-expressed protein 19.2 [Peromyscus leucopus]|uniref:testis-expressed protein 19.2 n=1 Tax=Peromyscus leucopus TaxID=10041 RepID=UPI0010A1D621|nr:testis-expressed protein 19.2 [Peromyscus leucopus]
MCPPVSVRHGAKGMSCLYAAWLYQLVHGDQMKICFACFKAAFLVVKNMLEMGDWDEEEWSAEPMELSEAGPDSEQWAGFSWGEGQGHLPHGTPVSTGPGILTPGPVGTEGIALGPQPVPTELGPQEAVPLDLGPEDAEWTQALPWRFDGLSPCSHWLIPPLSWWDIFSVSPSPGQPVLLELSPIWPMDPLEAEAWLVDLKFVFLLGGFDAICYLLSMTPCWAVRTRVQRWQMLLDPGEVRVAQLQNAPEQQDLNRWKLSILESSELGVEMVPADCSLRKGGFKVHSYLPWHNSTPEAWSREPGERLFIMEVISLRELPCFRSPSPDSHN